LLELVAYRCAAWDTPFWTDPNPGEGRYNRAGEAPISCFGLHPLTPWAEQLRTLEITDAAAAQAVRPPLWVARVQLEETQVVELTFDESQARGLNPEDLVGDDYRACQALASALREDDTAPKAIVAPSAALPGTRNLILLGERVISPLLLEPVDATIDTPASVAAVRGRTPLDLLPLVRHRYSATRHAALEAWERGQEYSFEEPGLRFEEIC
jgi:hypothetical protein